MHIGECAHEEYNPKQVEDGVGDDDKYFHLSIGFGGRCELDASVPQHLHGLQEPAHLPMQILFVAESLAVLLPLVSSLYWFVVIT